MTNFFNKKILEINSHLIKIEPELNNNINTNNIISSNLINKENKDSKESKENKSTKKEKDKKTVKSIKTKEENNTQLESDKTPIEPLTKLDLKDNIVIIYRLLDVLFKCYPNLAFSHKKGMSLKKVMKKYSYNDYPTFSATEAKKEGLMNNIKFLSSDLKRRNSKEKANDILKKNLIGINIKEEKEKNKKDVNIKINKHNSTQRKDIFYNSFKNIKERHQLKEERINNLERQKKKIIKELVKEKNGNKNKKVKWN